MTKVKICGITNIVDALHAAESGADSLGFNFYEKSPRFIDPVKARKVIDQLSEEIHKVGVFVNESVERIVEIVDIAGLDSVQLHGDESPDFATELKSRSSFEVIKAFRISTSFDIGQIRRYDVDAILLDAWSEDSFGGTGEGFDWETAKQAQMALSRMYLAGGLNPDNVVDAIGSVRPYAVDACSGLESFHGIKDHKKIEAFIRNVRRAI